MGSVAFGIWPPTGKGPNEGVATNASAQANVRTLGAVGIAQDGTVGTDPLGIVASVDHGATGAFTVHLNFAVGPNMIVNATLLGVAGEIDASASASQVLVHTRDSAGAAADKPFYLQIVG